MITFIRKCGCMALMLAASYGVFAQQQEDTVGIDYRSLPDSLITPFAIQRLIPDGSDRAQKMLDVLAERKLQPQYYIDYLQGRIYSKRELYKIGIHYYELSMQNTPESDWSRMMFDAALLINYEMLEDYDNVVRCAEDILKVADPTQMKHKGFITQALVFLGRIHLKLGDDDKAEEHFNRAIEASAGTTSRALFDQGNAHISYAVSLMDRELYEKAYPNFQKADSLITALIPLDSAYTSSCRAMQGDYMPRMAMALHKLGREREAEQWYQKFMTLDIVNENPETDSQLYYAKFIVDYLISAKRYHEALAILGKYESYLQGKEAENSLSGQEAYKQLSSIHAALNNYRNAYAYAQKQLAVTDSIRVRQKKTNALEMATIYETNKKELLIQKTQAELLQREIELTAAAIGLLMLLAIVLLVLINRRKIQQKNRAMVKQIKEMQEQWETQEQEILNKPLPDASSELLRQNEKDIDILCQESRRDKLCNDIRNIMLKERVYRDPSLSRDDLISRLGVNKAAFIEAFQYCFGATFPAYINGLRLKDAIILLEKSDLSLEEIAEKAGFGTSRTFQRQFQKEYGMSPRDFRKMAQK